MYFSENALVLTLNGFKSIKDINNKDVVLTSEGSWKPVLNVLEKSVDKAFKINLYNMSIDLYTDENIEGVLSNLIIQKDYVNNSLKHVLSKPLDKQTDFIDTNFDIIKYNNYIRIPFEDINNALTLQRLLLNTKNIYSYIEKCNENFILIIDSALTTVGLEYNIEPVVDDITLYTLEVKDQNSFTIFNGNL